MLGTYPTLFSQGETFPGYFPIWQLPKSIPSAAFGALACSSRSTGPRNCLNSKPNPTYPAYKKCASDRQKLYVWPPKGVHPTYKKCTSDLQKVYIQPTNSVHPTYEKCLSELQKVYIRPIKVYIRPAIDNHQTCNSEHLTYKRYTSDLQKVYIRPKKSVHPTY